MWARNLEEHLSGQKIKGVIEVQSIGFLGFGLHVYRDCIGLTV